MPKNAQITTQLHSSHMLVKSCSKFSKPGFSNTCTVNFQIFKLVLEKAEEPEFKLPTSVGSQKKQENFRKTSTFASLTTAFDCVHHNKLENSSRDGNTRPYYLLPEKPACRSRSSSQNWTQNGLVPNWKRSTSRLHIVTLLIYLICRVHHEKS